jgi:hypothetical protein
LWRSTRLVDADLRRAASWPGARRRKDGGEDLRARVGNKVRGSKMEAKRTKGVSNRYA